MSLAFKLLVFDWDGTLMDSEARIINCMRGAIKDAGAAPRSDEQIRDIIGLGLLQAIETLFPDVNSALAEYIVQAYRRRYTDTDPTPSQLFPGTAEVLETLVAQGYLLAVATGKARKGLDSVLELTGLCGIFHASRCADETFSKPHPQMLHDILLDLDVTARQTLMIGDTEYDMQMSRNAGAGALAVSYGVHALPRLLQQQPLGYINNITELPLWLDNYGNSCRGLRTCE